MAWVRLDDGFFTNPKVVSVSAEAKLLYLAALAYSSRELTDGLVSAGALRVITAVAEVRQPKRAAVELVTAGLWEDSGPEGHRIHDYHLFNPTREAVLKRRASDAGRKRSPRGLPPPDPPESGWEPLDFEEESDAPPAGIRPESTRNPNGVRAESAPRAGARVRPAQSQSPTQSPSSGANAPASPSARARAGTDREQPPPSEAKNLAPLFEAFAERGLPRPLVAGRELQAAQLLVQHFGASEVADCWADIRAGRWGDSFDRQRLSFDHLTRQNRVGNWQLWRENPGQFEAGELSREEKLRRGIAHV